MEISGVYLPLILILSYELCPSDVTINARDTMINVCYDECMYFHRTYIRHIEKLGSNRNLYLFKNSFPIMLIKIRFAMLIMYTNISHCYITLTLGYYAIIR